MGKRGPKKGTRPSGRQKGTPNKLPRTLKDAVLEAATAAGGEGGLKAYLQAQAMSANPNAFMSLLGRIIPLVHSGDPDNPVQHAHAVEVTFVQAGEDK